MDIDLKEVLRYMGSGNSDVKDEILSAVTAVCDMLQNTVSPRYVYRIFPIIVSEDTVRVADTLFISRRLASHLKDCNKAAILAATLGTQADTIIRRSMVSGTVNSSAAQAAGTAMIEQVADIATEAIEKESGLKAIPRFSPGYADWELSAQRDMLSLCDAQKRIGITLTESLMMIPTKSVTAIIGLNNTGCTAKKDCSQCDKKDCDYRL
ncbi:MAG: vitamin B12 dependent-methionine synthase activation domain-containing protein [Clostridia bacterium]|nr:vitamin B12 dependent-methionine synthase activation domain-containing protein [Clostridia bacterium]